MSKTELKRFVLDGVLVEEVPCADLPFTNMCNYCVLKETACYDREDVTCHSDSRPDGVDVVFRNDVIYCDVPWFYNSRKAGNERNYLPTRFGGGAEKHYPLMKDAEILAMRPMLDNCAAKNCALFMWATCPRLDSAIDVIKGWGFRYCTVAFVWEKITKPNGRRGLAIPPPTPIYGPGYYTASNAELVLLGCRGSMRPQRPMIQQIVRAPRREHSRKPNEVRRRIELMYPDARRLEMFARESWPGWDTHGDQVEMFEATA